MGQESDNKVNKSNGADNGSQKSSLAKLAKPSQRRSVGAGAKLRNYLLTGLIVVGPMLITLYGAYYVIDSIDKWVWGYLPDYRPEVWIKSFFKNNFDITLSNNFVLPGVGLIVAVFMLMFIGALTANLFGRTLVSYGEMVMGRMPVVRNVYSALKQIFETVLTSSGNNFKTAGLIEYPRPGLYAIVFISKETAGEIGDYKDEFGDELLSVFLPTTPNPTSGFLLFVPRKDIKILDMTVEEAAKLVISAGLVEPGVPTPKLNPSNGLVTHESEEKDGDSKTPRAAE